MKINPIYAVDGYKFSHGPAYPADTNMMYDVFTPRTNKYFNSPFFKDVEGGSPLIWFGAQAFVLQWLVHEFKENFFDAPKHEVIPEFKEFLDGYLGPDSVSTEQVEALWDLQYLPLLIKSIPEGHAVQMKTPVLTVRNTQDGFAWLVGYLETLMSSELWPAATAATIAFNYRCIGEYWSKLTCDDNSHLDFQFHDFSARGDMGIWASSLVGMGHLSAFKGTDGVFALKRLQKQYDAMETNYFYGGSVPATEHSVMCMGTKDGEIETFQRLIQEVYPTGIVSIVSDTWDYWKVITEYLPTLSDIINERDGKVVIRPDSGDPVDIICGRDFTDATGLVAHLGQLQTILSKRPAGEVMKFHNEYFEFSVVQQCLVQVPEHVVLGSIEMMWRTFGGHINKKGFKVLNPKIGLIYGDSITMERADIILRKLAAKSFASCNVVLGIGSYTYQYVTRDTFGFAMKATYGIVGGEPREIFKDPATDDGTKKSAKGLIAHNFVDGGWVFKDQATQNEESDSELQTIFCEGRALLATSVKVVRMYVEREVEKAVAAKLEREGK